MFHFFSDISNQNSLAIEAFFSVVSPLVEGSRVRRRIISTRVCSMCVLLLARGGGGGRVQGSGLGQGGEEKP